MPSYSGCQDNKSQYKRLNRKYKSNSLLNLLSKAQIRFSARTVLGKNF